MIGQPDKFRRGSNRRVGNRPPQAVQSLDTEAVAILGHMFLVGTQRINDAGHLEIGGCDTVTLARHFETPLYVFDEADIRDRCRTYRAAFESRYPNVTIAYAGRHSSPRRWPD